MAASRSQGSSGGAAGTAAAAALLAVAAATARPSTPAPTTPAGSEVDVAPGPHTAKSGLLGRLDLFQQRTRGVRFGVGVVRKFSDDRAGRLAALIAYYGFFSVFPALLALVTVLGFVLEDDPGLRADIADSALGQFPIIGDQIASSVADPLTGSPLALIIGLGGALWAGMGMVQACQDAMNEVWAVERADYPSFIGKRIRSLVMLAAMGVLVVSSTGATQLVNVVAPGALAAAGLLVASVALNLLVFMVAYRVLTVADVGWRTVLPGAGFAAVAYTALQYVGGLYVGRTLDGASATYGTFAVVIGLLSWIFLIAQMMVLGAEINVVAARRIWPRSLFGDPVTRGDRHSQASQVRAQRMNDKMRVDVRFDPAVPDSDSDRDGATATGTSADGDDRALAGTRAD
jgi:YihY family inner membrane protein